ncbi:MAG TPA: BrnT family toxin [Steroidobacteraceae bacterium]|nr:BrnT family toxin [Steroidobacteraceae bacterium]
MRFEFDARKDRANRKKHGLSLEFAERLDWNAMAVRIEERRGEERWFGLALAEGRLYSIAFTVRDEHEDRETVEVVRPISLRRATKAEERRYATESHD